MEKGVTVQLEGRGRGVAGREDLHSSACPCAFARQRLREAESGRVQWAEGMWRLLVLRLAPEESEQRPRAGCRAAAAYGGGWCRCFPSSSRPVS